MMLTKSSVRKRRWRGAWVAACLCCAAALAACATPTPPPEPVTIRFVWLTGGVGDRGGGTDEYYELLADEFSETHPHVTIDAHAWSGREQYDTLAAPEFFIRYWSGMGGVRSLDGFVERDASFDVTDFYPEVADLFAYDGEMWGVPIGTDLVVMYYNKDLFDAYGVPYPGAGWTWDDFLDRALALRDEGAGVYGYAPWNVSPYSEYTDAVFFLYQHGGRLVDDLHAPTRATFDDPLNVEALAWYADLIHVHDVAPSPEQVRSDLAMGERDPYIGVVSGKVGMWVGVLSEQGTGVPWSFDWGMVPLPRGAQAATLAWGWGYAIASDAVDPDTCWEWIAFLSEQLPERLVPARVSLAESREFGELTAAEVARGALEGTLLVPYEALWGWDEGRTMQTFATATRKIAEGSATAAEALSTAQEVSE